MQNIPSLLSIIPSLCFASRNSMQKPKSIRIIIRNTKSTRLNLGPYVARKHSIMYVIENNRCEVDVESKGRARWRCVVLMGCNIL